MCGIAGMFGPDSPPEVFQRIHAAIAHRGPDASGVYQDQTLQLGMHRLKFRGGDIPLPVRGDGWVSSYNGQLFGHFEDDGRYVPLEAGLDKEVTAAHWHTTADGMYALSVYSPTDRRLLLRTDQFFTKPLFYRKTSHGVAFCSELSPLLAVGSGNRLHVDALAELFAFGWYLSDQSYVKDVSLVSRNDVSVVGNEIAILPKVREAIPTASRADGVALRTAIRRSVERMVDGSGPLGLALSGGLDSSILAWELNDIGIKDLICITVCAGPSTDELQTLAELGLPPGGAWRSWRHVRVEVNEHEFLADFERSVVAFGQPTTMSSLPLYFRLAEAAASAGVRALLLGEGVDEHFGGYASYRKLEASEPRLSYYLHGPRTKLVRTLMGNEAYGKAWQRMTAQYGEATDLRSVEVQMRLARLLLRSDVCLMAKGIEGRVPFLHNEIPGLALSIPWEELRCGLGKGPLRTAYADALGGRALRPKARFKSSDAMLLQCLATLEQRIISRAGRALGVERVTGAIALLRCPDSFDADVLTLLLSLTFLFENGVIR